MTEIMNTKTFTNLDEWLEWFKTESFSPIRKAILDGLFFSKRFDDYECLIARSAPRTRLKYMMKALSSTGLNQEIIDHGLKLILTRLVRRQRAYSWPRIFTKQDILGFLKFLDKIYRRNDLKLILADDWLKQFLSDVLYDLRPIHNTPAENVQIVRTVFACKKIELLSRCPIWRGHEAVILEFVKRFRLEKVENPFSIEGWKAGLSDQFASHLAAAGKLDDTIKEI